MIDNSQFNIKEEFIGLDDNVTETEVVVRDNRLKGLGVKL